MEAQAYLKELSDRLTGRLPRRELESVLNYYKEYFAEKGEDGARQAEEELGTPEEAAARILRAVSRPDGRVRRSWCAGQVAAAVVLTMDTMKNAFKVATGKMTRSELAQELVKELMVSSAALAVGTIAQAFIEIPVLGFMIGSFVGSAIGSFAYNCGYSAVMSFCVDTGFTMFGLVKQDYTLPEDVLEYIGVDVFQYEKFLPKQFQKQNFTPLNFNQKEFEANTLGIRILRRGVIGVSEIGYV